MFVIAASHCGFVEPDTRRIRTLFAGEKGGQIITQLGGGFVGN